MNKKLAVLLISFLIFNPVGWGPASSPPSAAAADTWQLVWSDEFDGPNGSAPDPTKWNLIDAGGGFGNNELQYYTRRRDNSYLENGSLVIVAKKENYNNHAYTSAKLTSQYKGDWKYGRFEIRAKLPYGRGMWPAIWMMPTDSVYGGWPKSGEIDIMENRGDQMNKVSGTIHYGNDWPNNQWSGADYFLPAGQSFADAYHTFAVEWEEGVSSLVCRRCIVFDQDELVYAFRTVSGSFRPEVLSHSKSGDRRTEHAVYRFYQPG